MTEKQASVVCYGEVLWDVYPEGKKLGGAPFNVAAHLRQLNRAVKVITRIGDDALGAEIETAISSQDLSLDYVQKDTTKETGVVLVTLDDQGHPEYEIKVPVAWDAIALTESNQQAVRESKALVFGSLACRSETSRATLTKLAQLSPLNICDLNIRQSFYDKELVTNLLELTDILKLNDEEAELLKSFYGLNSEKALIKLAEDFGLKLIIITKGGEGVTALSEDEEYFSPAEKIQVVDTVGSGDAFLAAFLDAYFNDLPISDCLHKGCKLGAYVATQPGAIPAHPTNLF